MPTGDQRVKKSMIFSRHRCRSLIAAEEVFLAPLLTTRAHYMSNHSQRPLKAACASAGLCDLMAMLSSSSCTLSGWPAPMVQGHQLSNSSSNSRSGRDTVFDTCPHIPPQAHRDTGLLIAVRAPFFPRSSHLFIT